MNQDVAALLCKKAAKAIKNSVTIKHHVAYHAFDSTEISDKAIANYEVYCKINEEWYIREFNTWNKVHTFIKQIILTKGANLVQEPDADALLLRLSCRRRSCKESKAHIPLFRDRLLVHSQDCSC